jgi:hypothetical protein
MAESESPQFVVTLVHGTFARRAHWIESDSSFSRGLAEQLDGTTVRIFPFRWSGRNSTHARDDAIVRLTGHLNQLKSRFPKAKHYVIGHSHGGAVAHEAGCNADLDGVVCLSTPFLILRERRHYETTLLGLTYATNLCLMCIVGFLGYLLGWSLPLPLYVSWPLRIALALSGSYAGYLLGELFSFELRRVAPLLAPHMSRRVMSGEKLLIIRMLGDEASLFLTAAIFLSWVWNLVMLVILLPMELLEWASAKSRSLVLVFLYVLFFIVTAPIVLPLVVASILPFGLHLALATPLFEISVEATPIGPQTCCLLTGGRMNRPWNALRHSTYDSRHVQMTIGRWMLTGEIAAYEPAEGLPAMLKT